MFRSTLGLDADQSPFPWQEELLSRLCECTGNRLSLDVPTGLGKTSVIAAWLVALARKADLPRRLVYVVDRRAVVDQATDEAVRLREWLESETRTKQLLGLDAGVRLPISTLRGQFADNREWLSDPTLPTIVVGTVDMVGSRLLFEGYGVSHKMRPYHAGFLGIDTLFVLDEAHLVPPFEALLQSVVETDSPLHGEKLGSPVVPRSMLLTLSATGRAATDAVLQIGDRDLKHTEASQRLNAVKQLTFHKPKEDESLDMSARLAAEAWSLSGEGTLPKRIIVFCNSRDSAIKIEAAVASLAKGDKKQGIEQRDIETQLFVGARRVRERQEVADWLKAHGFIAGSEVTAKLPSFVFSTSAGEVGVDLDADHMVSDLVPFERMVQRFGRVNRRGEGAAEVRVVLERNEPNAKEKPALKKALAKPVRERKATDHLLVAQFDLARKYQAAIEALPRVEGSDAINVSPEALRQLRIRAADDDQLREVLNDATTQPPLRPALTRPILDSWSMTSLEKHSARPNVAPWLRGWIDEEPQTTVVWRRWLPTRSVRCSDSQIKEFFEAAPIHLTEKLETQSDHVFKWLLKHAEKVVKLSTSPKKGEEEMPGDDEVVAIVLDHSGGVTCQLTLKQLQFYGGKDAQYAKKQFERDLQNRTLVVDRRLGGINSGLLDQSAKDATFAESADDADCPRDWITQTETGNDETGDDKRGNDKTSPIPAFRIVEKDVEPAENEDASRIDRVWKTCLRLPIARDDQDEPSRVLILQKYRRAVTSEESRSTSSELSLDVHLAQTEVEATRLAERLQLSDELKLVLRIAARNHDHGKNTERWQNAFSAPEEGRPFAKTSGPFRNNLLDGYRHEFGSLPFVLKDPEFESLSEAMRDLALHLVAAHHGFARPVIRVDGCKDAPPSQLEERARDVALRFARLQKQWGPWGLAWLESLLRAADQRASAAAEAREDSNAVTATTPNDITAEVTHG